MRPGIRNWVWSVDRPRTSPHSYLATPPLITRMFWCWPEIVEQHGDRAYVIPAHCGLPGHCATSRHGYDPGDEDVRP